MEKWDIQLQTASLNGRLLNAQEELTGMRDGLILLETEAEGLSESWQGESFRQWKAELENCLEEAGALAAEVKQLISAVYQCAHTLAQLEQNMIQETEGW